MRSASPCPPAQSGVTQSARIAPLDPLHTGTVGRIFDDPPHSIQDIANLVGAGGDANGFEDVFVRDLRAGTTIAASGGALLGFGEALRVLLENLEITNGARGLPGIDNFTTLPIVFLCLAGGIFVARNFLRSRWGAACIAVRGDPIAAETAGVGRIPVTGIRLALEPGFLQATLHMLRAGTGPFGQKIIFLDRLKELTMPVLVMWGKMDQVVPFFQARDAVGRLRDGGLSAVSGCGHMPHVETPGLCADHIHSFAYEKARR